MKTLSIIAAVAFAAASTARAEPPTWYALDFHQSTRCLPLATYAMISDVPVRPNPTPANLVENSRMLGTRIVDFRQNANAAMAMDNAGRVVGFYRGYAHCQIARAAILSRR